MAAITTKNTMLVTGTWNSKALLRQAVLRALLMQIGGLSIFWSLTALPSFQLTATLSDVSARIIADDRFQPGALSDLLSQLKSTHRPNIMQPECLQGQALIALRAAEEVLQRKASDEADLDVDAASRRVREALSANPTNSFLWLMLYSAETTRSGFDPRNVSLLEQSYAFGPHEGWIALRRNQLALAAFPMLTNLTQEVVISEFAELIDADFIEQATQNLLGVGWRQRDRLLAALRGVDITSKISLHKRLSGAGVKLAIPGVEIDERPWR